MTAPVSNISRLYGMHCAGAANAVDCTAIPGEVKNDKYLLMKLRPIGFGSPEEPDMGHVSTMV